VADEQGIGYDQEEAYFHQKDRELLAKKRAQLDSVRQSAGATSMTCPRCGAVMAEVCIEYVKIDRCTGCRGVFLDNGELELLTHAKSGGVFKCLFGK